MANSNKTDNYDVVGGIFDFIFKESSKPPQKRRPVYPSGNLARIPPDDKLIAADLLAALAAPGVFVSNTALEEFKDALDIELLNINMDGNGGIKMKAGDLGKLIKDPAGFVEKAYMKAKSKRKQGRASFLRGATVDLVTNAWAHKYGDKEAQKAVLAGTVANQKERSYIASRALGQYQRGGKEATDLDFMAQRSLDLLGRKTFGDQWETMDKREKIEFAGVLSRGQDLVVRHRTTKGGIEGFLTSKYSPEVAQNFSSAISGGRLGAVKSDEVLDIFDPNLYRKLEKENLVDRIQTSDGPDKEMYKRVLLLLEANRPELNQKIGSLKEELKKTTDRARRSVLEEELKDAKALVGVLNTKSVAGLFGSAEGYINSIKSVWIGKGVNPIKSIWDGSFFDKDKNLILNPVENKSIGIGKDLFENIEFKSAKYDPTKGKLWNGYNKVGEAVYYANPRTWIRTLVTGEGFAWIANNKMNSALKMFGGLEGFEDIHEYAKTLLSNTSVADLSQGLTSLMARIQNANGGNKLSPQQLQSIQNLFNSSASFRKLAHRFSALKRFSDKIKDKVLTATKGLREKIIKMLESSKFFGKLLEKYGGEAIKPLIEQFVAKGSIQALVKAFVTSIATAIGIPTTGPGAILVYIVTSIIIDIAWKVGKFLVKTQVAIAKFEIDLYKLLLLGVVGIMILVFSMGSGSYNKYNRLNTSYANVIPGSVNSCSDYDMDPIIGSDYDTPDIPPRTDTECPLGEGFKLCYQGWDSRASSTNRICGSHNYPGMHVDLHNVEFIYAPQFCSSPGGECKIVSTRRWTCGSDSKYAGDEVIFSASDGQTTYTLNLLHVRLLSGYSGGNSVAGGEAFAYVQTGAEIQSGNCWTGFHLHVEYTKMDGTSVDPLKLFKSFNCDITSDVNQCSSCNGG